jgi:Tfp pilus assembly protein PilV
VTSPALATAIRLANAALAKHGKAATITWAGKGATAVRAASDESEKVKLFTGKRETRIAGDRVTVITNAIMSAVSRNPVGAKITQGGNTYTVIASDDLGQAPDGIAAHKLVLM